MTNEQEQAVRELREVLNDSSLSPYTRGRITRAIALIQQGRGSQEQAYQSLLNTYEIVKTKLSQTQSALEQSEACCAGLRLDAHALCESIGCVHNDPKYRAVWELSQLHLGPYTGLQYDRELKALNESCRSSTFGQSFLDERKRMRGAFGMDTVWPLVDVLKEAAVAIRHLLGNHDCDCNGHEQFSEIEIQLCEYETKCREALKETK